MSKKEAFMFLRGQVPERYLPDESSDAFRLIDELTYLPLAIAQAAAYLNENPQLTLPEYLQHLEDAEDNMVLKDVDEDMAGVLDHEFSDGTRYPDSSNAVATTWVLSMNQIQESDPAAADMLAFMSVIEPKTIPVSIIPSQDTNERKTRAIGTLCLYAFVARRGTSDIYDMHRLVHIAACLWMQRHRNMAQVVKAATSHLEALFPVPDFANRKLWRQYLPHVLRLLQRTEGTNLEDTHLLCQDVALCMLEDGRHREAVEWMEKSVRWHEASRAEDDHGRPSSRYLLATAYTYGGQAPRAIKLLEERVVSAQETLAEDDRTRLASEYQLAAAYLSDRQISRAFELLMHIVAIEKTLPEEDDGRLKSESALAMAYLDDGQIAEATKLLEHVVAVQRRTLVEDHPDRLSSEYELALASLANRQIPKAVEILEHIVAVRKTLAEDHYSRLASEHTLAHAYLEEGKISRAIVLLDHVVKIQKSIPREDQPDVVVSQRLLEIAYQTQAESSS